MSNQKHDTLLRQWEMLALIPRYPKSIRTDDLYQALLGRSHPVTKRTVERNLTDLSVIFPLTTETVGRTNLWSWAKGSAAMQLPGMTAEEAMVFHLAKLHLERLLPASMVQSLRPYFLTAQLTLRALDSGNAKRRLLDRVRIVGRGSGPVPAKVSSHVKETILRGLLEQKKVSLTYVDPDSDVESQRTVVSVQGLVQRMLVVLVVVTMERKSQPLSLRLHRIATARLLDEPADVVDHINLGEFA